MKMNNLIMCIIALAFTSGMLVILSIDNCKLRKEKKNREDEMVNAVDLSECCMEEESVHGSSRVERALESIKEAEEEIKLGTKEMRELQDEEDEWLEKLNKEYKDIADERSKKVKHAYEVIRAI